MILVSQDGFKAFNMAYIKGYYICEGKLGNIPPSFPSTKEGTEYIIWVDPEPFWNNEKFYSIGRFKKLEDAQKVFQKLTSINPSAEGCILIKDNDVDFFGKDLPVWRSGNADNK